MMVANCYKIPKGTGNETFQEHGHFVKRKRGRPKGSKKVKTGVPREGETNACFICRDRLSDPVAIPCGHKYCKNCITTQWDLQDEGTIYSCPQCGQTFTPRPDLVKNIVITVLDEKLKKTRFQGMEDHCYAGSVGEVHGVRNRRRPNATKCCSFCLPSRCQKPLHAHHKPRPFKKHKKHMFVDPPKKHQENICARHNEVMTMFCHVDREKDVKVLEQKDVTAKLGDVGRFRCHQQETERDVELKQLVQPQDSNHFPINNVSPPDFNQPARSSSINIRPLRFTDNTAVMSDISYQLQDFRTWTDISRTPVTRAEFLQYTKEMTVDPNTVHRRLSLSEGNEKVTIAGEEHCYAGHPERFMDEWQVLSKESLTGRCYWEVEWTGGGGVGVAVAYKNISRAGRSGECGYGYNDQSWVLDCYPNCCNFLHNRVSTEGSGGVSSRVGVYLDHSAGTLSFYSVSVSMTLLHRVQTMFTQPLHAGVGLFYFGSTAEFCKID